ncbi:mechanosensitive ion channel [Ramlibacter solisilvae]|uniref:Mechanosensitive ion channel protein MscS n=1 Tax=Ramlibacter tataouinensis TaxID=94132 RepID=A0A127JQ11_9BURK|nr:mechanosensitive ion channel domain-containing protein [Ramlibacter tataouinensis]AMO21983.1 mechanosensitive ion channel protein MscS [Ramlibacter tataouinensis]
MLRELLYQDPWTAAIILALIAVVSALIVHYVGGGLLRRTFTFAPVIHSVLVATEASAGFAMPLIALQAVWEALPSSLFPRMPAVRHANAVLMIAALTWLAMAAVSGLAQGLIKRHSTESRDNLRARRIETQARVLSRSAMVLIGIAGAAIALMTFPAARAVGTSLLASAGVLGVVAGLAARPIFSNLFAGMQIAVTQPIRMGDVLIIKGEWGTVEEITGTYVVLRIWDERRLIIPLNWFIENPFENWTRTGSDLYGTVILHVDHATPIDVLRAQARKIVEASPHWDRKGFAVQVQNMTERSLEVRVLMSATDSGQLWDLRCQMREQMLAFLARELPHCLPRVRVDDRRQGDASSPPP